MPSIRPSMPNLPPTAPIQQNQAPAAKTEAPKQEARAENPAQAQDANETRSFEDGGIEANAFPFESTEAAEKSAEIGALLDAEEIEEVEQLDESEAPDEIEETENEADIEAAEELETEEELAELEVEEEEEADETDADSEGGGQEVSVQISLGPLLDLIPELENIPKFKIVESWGLFQG